MSEEKGKEDSQIKNIQPPKQRPLFTQQQIAEQVRDFIYAYRVGNIKLKHQKVENSYEPITVKHLTNPVLESYKIAEKQFNHKSEHTRTKNELQDLIRICEGTKTATDEERYQKLLELFDRILTLQTDDRLEGKIESYDLKRRVEELETKISGVIAKTDLFGGNDV